MNNNLLAGGISEIIFDLTRKELNINWIHNSALTDFNKAFDTLKHCFMISAIEKQRVSRNFIKLIKEMYTGLKARIKTAVAKECLEVKKEMG